MSTQYSGPLTDIDGMVAGDVSDLSKSVPIAWPEAQRICDIPEVREALDAFALDAREENMLAMVSAIMGHASAQGRAAGLEEVRLGRRVSVDAGALKMVLNTLRRDAEEGRTARGEMADALWESCVREDAALSPTSSEAGKDDARDAARYRWLKAWGKTDGFSDEAIDREIATDAALSSLKVIGKGEKG